MSQGSKNGLKLVILVYEGASIPDCKLKELHTVHDRKLFTSIQIAGDFKTSVLKV